MTIEVPNEALEFLGKSQAKMGGEILVAAVLRWFEEGRLSQGQASTMLGLKRGEFFQLLNERRVSPIQMSVEDLGEDFRRGDGEFTKKTAALKRKLPDFKKDASLPGFDIEVGDAVLTRLLKDEAPEKL